MLLVWKGDLGGSAEEEHMFLLAGVRSEYISRISIQTRIYIYICIYVYVCIYMNKSQT
jgi:hypothetical protein